MSSSSVNLQMVAKVAHALTPLQEPIVFVGGAIIAIYQDDPAPARATDDVDCIVQVATRSEFAGMEQKLRNLGFKHVTDSKVICRWKLEGTIVDVMPTEPKILGFSNSWYHPGFEARIARKLPDGTVVLVMPLAYFLASKFEALHNRGSSDWRISHELCAASKPPRLCRHHRRNYRRRSSRPGDSYREVASRNVAPLTGHPR